MALTTSEILELIRAGYSKAEIDAMVNPASVPAPANTETPDGENRPESVAAAEPDRPESVSAAEPDRPESVQEKTPSEVEKLVAALGIKLDTLTRAIQTRNVQQTENPNTELTPADVVARIINPHLGGA